MMIKKNFFIHKRKRDDLSDNEKNSDSITQIKTIDLQLHLEIKKIKKLILRCGWNYRQSRIFNI